jgi:hypothetical protein
MAQEVKCLPRKLKDLSSNTSTAKPLPLKPECSKRKYYFNNFTVGFFYIC